MKLLLIYMAIYLIPAFIMFYMSLEVALRNLRKTEHWLLSGYIACYGVLFVSEFIRQQADVSYSPYFVTYIFGNAGLLILSLSIHFIFKITRAAKRVPKYIYPWIFYIPCLPIPLTLLFGINATNSKEFVKQGIFIYPEFNVAYIATMTTGLVMSLLIVWMLYSLYKRTNIRAQKSVLKLLAIVAILVLVWNTVFGLFEFRGVLPPYPYIYGGLIWILSLMYGMKKFDFLESYHMRFSTLHDINPLAIFLIDHNGIIESANPAAEELLGVRNLRGKVFTNFISEERRSKAMENYSTLFQKGARIHQYETRIVNQKGKKNFVLLDGDFIFIDQQLHMMVIAQDVQFYKDAEETIRFLAYHDPLTKLANRHSFYEEAEKALLTFPKFALIVLDLDDFKSVNDTYGHQVGDDYLIHVGNVLQLLIAKKGMAARVGGDEFYAYYVYTSDEQVTECIHELMNTFDSSPFWRGNDPISVRFSLGAAKFPEHGNKLETLISKADQAMYKVKRKKKNDFFIWSDTATLNDDDHRYDL